jgi:glutamate synthase domain-containing protein 2
MAEPEEAPAVPRSQRLMRNYLLDAPLQLRFTLLALTSALCAAALLGVFLARAASALSEQAQGAVEARESAALASRELGNAALGKNLLERFDDPAFAAALERQSQAIDEAYQREHQAVIAQRTALEREQKRATWVLLVSLLAFVVGVVSASIVATHKIAGPVYRVRRLLEALAEGRRDVPTHSLRSGDELRELFETAAGLIQALRADDESALRAVAAALGTSETSGVGAASLEDLRVLQSRLRMRLGMSGSTPAV